MVTPRREQAIGQFLKNAADLELKGRITEAIEEVKKAVGRKTDDGNLYNRLGDLYLKAGNKEEAVVNFRRGVEVYRKDNFLRNALALGKKILRHEPDGFDMYYTIADVLVELDEKHDAVKYMTEYIERQIDQKREREALNAIEYLQGLEIRGEGIEGRISEFYKKLGIEGIGKRPVGAAVAEPPPVEEPAEKVQAPVRPAQAGIARPPVTEPASRTSVGVKETAHAGGMLKEIERAIADLRKAMQSDSVVPAVQKSLGVLSAEQLKAIGDMQRSVAEEIDRVYQSLKELAQRSGRSAEELRGTLENLNRALGSLSRNQARNTQQLNTSLGDLNATYKALTENSLNTIHSVQDTFKQAAEDMCRRLDETKTANIKTAAASADMKGELGKMADAVTRFLTAQTLSQKKRDLYLLIILVVVSVTCGLVLLSLVLK